METKMRVLIGYDGSASAEKVVEDLKLAGLPNKALAMVFSAADVYVPAAIDATVPTQIRSVIGKSRERALKSVRLAESLSEHGARVVKKAFPHWKVISESCADSPSWGLVNKAQRWKADLIVLGAHGHSTLGRFLGSVSQMVVVHAAQSVRIARPRLNSAAKKIRIFVGVDGSENAKKAIDVVARRVWPARTEVFLMSVMEPKMSALMRHLTPTEIQWFLEKADDERTALGHVLEFYAKKLRKKGLVVTCRVQTGDPKKLLVEQAEQWRANSIFMGARGLSDLKRMMIGGVCAAVSARAHCSVEVVRK